MNKLNKAIRKANSKYNKENFESFKRDIFKHTLIWEGGAKLHKLKGDSGGWTIYGIAFNYNKEYFKDLADFKDTVYDEAAAIAFCKYYLPANVNLVQPLAQIMYFDMAYNLGTRRTIKMMQKLIGVVPDGIIGRKTKEKMYLVSLEKLTEVRKRRYYRLAENNARLKRFLKGWLNRTNDIEQRSYKHKNNVK